MASEQRWQDPDTGIVHDVGLEDSWFSGERARTHKQMCCGIQILIDEDGNLKGRKGIIVVPWTATRDPTSCIECITHETRQGDIIGYGPGEPGDFQSFASDESDDDNK